MELEYPREESACFTGHRQMTDAELVTAEAAIAIQVEQLLAEGVQHYYAGGAIGFDMIAAQTVLKLKETRFPTLTLTLALPFRGHASRWREEDKRALASLMLRADRVVYVSEHYSHFCMQMRNIYMVDRSHVCLAYLREKRGGTHNTVTYAKRCGITVVNLAENGKDENR